MVPRVHCITDLASAVAPAEATSRTPAPLPDARVSGAARPAGGRGRSGRRCDPDPGGGGPRPCPVRLTTMVVDRLRLLGATVIVNGRLDVALVAGTDGGHLGLADLPVRPVRHVAPQGFLVGVNCRNEEHARQARDEGADYLGVGPVYATDTKQGLPDPVGHGRPGSRCVPAGGGGGRRHRAAHRSGHSRTCPRRRGRRRHLPGPISRAGRTEIVEAVLAA